MHNFQVFKTNLLKVQQPLFSGENSKLKCTMKQSLWMPHKLNPTSLLTNIWECPDQQGWTARKMFYGTGSRVRTEVDKQTDTLVNMKYTGCSGIYRAFQLRCTELQKGLLWLIVRIADVLNHYWQPKLCLLSILPHCSDNELICLPLCPGLI